jgi:hydrophobic/amphiphilic exporter-1 (mainly G- bacteria), HAE1 family
VYLYLDRVSQWLSPKRHADKNQPKDDGVDNDDPAADDEATRKRAKLVAAQ